jgi:hypothetical protein
MIHVPAVCLLIVRVSYHMYNYKYNKGQLNIELYTQQDVIHEHTYILYTSIHMYVSFICFNILCFFHTSREQTTFTTTLTGANTRLQPFHNQLVF